MYTQPTKAAEHLAIRLIRNGGRRSNETDAASSAKVSDVTQETFVASPESSTITLRASCPPF